MQPYRACPEREPQRSAHSLKTASFDDDGRREASVSRQRRRHSVLAPPDNPPQPFTQATIAERFPSGAAASRRAPDFSQRATQRLYADPESGRQAASQDSGAFLPRAEVLAGRSRFGASVEGRSADFSCAPDSVIVAKMAHSAHSARRHIAIRDMGNRYPPARHLTSRILFEGV